MTCEIEPPNSVLLLVGREGFTPPSSFDGGTCVATADCLAVGVLSDHGPTQVVMLSVAPPASDLVTLGTFLLESEGLLSLRDVYSREHATVGVAAGAVEVTVLGNDDAEPSKLAFVVRELP